MKEQDDTRSVDLRADPLQVRFSRDALLNGAALDLYRGDVLVFHLKYLSLRNGFVLNDLRDGNWGAEHFVSFPRPEAGDGIRAIVALTDDGPELRLPGGAIFPLGERFDLSGPLRAAVPGAIGLDDSPAKPELMPAVPRHAVHQTSAWDAFAVSERGVFVEGWIDDRAAPLAGLLLVDTATGQRIPLPAHRLRRVDVEHQLQSSLPSEFGIWTAARLRAGTEAGALGLRLLGPDGTEHAAELPNPIRKPGHDFLDFLLTHFGRRELLGDLTTRSMADLDAGHGAMLAAIHDDIAATRAIRLEAKFGPHKPGCQISLICVLLGIPDFLYLLVSEFARFGPLDAFEFVFVSNSPELEEALVRDAELASFVFGARIVVASLNQNCGFGHANNVGVAAAQAGTVGIINPDVYPRDAAAVAHMLRLAEGGLGDDVVGGKLYYADGSVMHDGMFFARDHKLSALAGGAVWTVEHFRKGFPDTAGTAPRRVPAITGALMVLEKSLYERMGGFDTGFIFGHYEDADLCLRIRQAGGNVLLDPALAYWHYEGMGSAKRPAQAGSRLFNRWLFTRRWADSMEAANHV